MVWAYSNELYEKEEEVLGSYIKIQGVNFMVVGTYKKRSVMVMEKKVKRKFLFLLPLFPKLLIRVMM